MMIDRALVAQFVRRRTLFNRVTAARNASQIGTAERTRLDDACTKCGHRLLETSTRILPGDEKKKKKKNELDADSINDIDTITIMGKWRQRLALELACLTTAREHLSCAIDTNTEPDTRLYVQLARNACAFVRRELKNEEKFGEKKRISAVLDKVARFERQATEQLAIFTAVDAEMYIDNNNMRNGKGKKDGAFYECGDFRRPLTLLLALA